MRKYLSVLIVLSIVILSTFNVSATTDKSITSSSPTKLRFDMQTRTIQEVDDVETSRVETYTTRTSDSGYSPEYSVDVSDEDLGANTRHLLGDWVPINPATGGRYRNTVYIEADTADGTIRGTGFMIGPSAVATAAHVVYNTEYGGDNFIESGTVFPAHADNSNPYGSSDIIGVVVYDAWTDDNNGEYDWAIIELNSNIGDNVGWLGLRYQGSSYNGTDISVNGYPKYVDIDNDGDEDITEIMYRSNGTISSSYTRLLRSVDTNTGGGMSGGPIYINSGSSGYTAIAIHSGSSKTTSGSKFNLFVRITQDVYNDLVAYRSIRV